MKCHLAVDGVGKHYMGRWFIIYIYINIYLLRIQIYKYLKEIAEFCLSYHDKTENCLNSDFILYLSKFRKLSMVEEICNHGNKTESYIISDFNLCLSIFESDLWEKSFITMTKLKADKFLILFFICPDLNVVYERIVSKLVTDDRLWRKYEKLGLK